MTTYTYSTECKDSRLIVNKHIPLPSVKTCIIWAGDYN